MTLEALANLGQLISALAVVASLAYLGFQVRQNTQSLRADTYARALDRVATLQARLAANPSLLAVLNRGLRDASSLTPEERIQFTWIFYEMFGAFEFMYHQSQAGALQDEVWGRWADTLAWWASFPAVQAWWRSKPTPFSPSFTAFVESRMSTGNFDAAAAQAWQEFLRTGSVSAVGSPPPA